MKKIMFLIMLVSPAVLMAQGFQLGVKGGVNVSNYTGGNLDTKSLIGFHVGGLMSFKLGNNVALQPEVLFSSQGAKYEQADQEENLTVSYINLPVLLKLKTNSGFFIEAGPQVGFKVGEDADVPNQTIENFANDLDLSVAGGLGYHSRSGFGISGRYIAGLSKVGDFNGNSIDPDFRNSVLQFSVFYTLFNNK
ncbi:MAG: PorT family protein [Chitinophagaceae bacterium]|nr:PorT family protein [Chitinophagaceae bacterium]